MVERAVAGFLPSVSGLHFANAFPPGPTLRLGPLDTRLVGIGDAAAGLCGGMALTACDLWAAGQPAPPDTAPPANGSRRFRALVRRQVQSLDWLRVPLRYALLGGLHAESPSEPLAPVRRGPVRVPTLLREWPLVQAELDAGRPCLLELIRVGGLSPAALVRNHQVLAWVYEADDASGGDPSAMASRGGRVRLGVYDPNHPGADDVGVELVVAPGGAPLASRLGIAQSTGEPLLGFFRGPVLTPAPVAAWR